MDVIDVKPPGRENRYLTDAQRSAIAAQVASGRSQIDVAKDFAVSSMTVSRIMREVKEVSVSITGDWRQIQANKAVAAVNAGLDDDTDSYKRAGIGVQVLKGLGVYAPDQQNQIAVLLQNMPSDIRQELASGTVESSFPVAPDDH